MAYQMLQDAANAAAVDTNPAMSWGALMAAFNYRVRVGAIKLTGFRDRLWLATGILLGRIG
jgi:hypothetical protein